MKVAVLALQGAFAEHQQMLDRLSVESCLIRNLDDWNDFVNCGDSDLRLILPGGESTAMLRILNDEALFAPIRKAVHDGMPVFGTCAGMILLAKDVEGEDRERLAAMDIRVRRNAYGRQLGSFYTESDCGDLTQVPMTFIRAPFITEAGEGVEVLSVVDGNIVAARQNRMLVCAFHPELNDDTRIHEMFLVM